MCSRFASTCKNLVTSWQTVENGDIHDKYESRERENRENETFPSFSDEWRLVNAVPSFPRAAARESENEAEVKMKWCASSTRIRVGKKTCPYYRCAMSGFPSVRLAGRSAQEASARPRRNSGAIRSTVRPQAASEA